MIFSLSFALVMFPRCAVAEDEMPAGPKMEIDKSLFSFGTVTEGATVTHNFLLRNTGSAPLIVDRIVSGCGCTTTTAAPLEIAPGASHDLTVSLNTDGLTGEKEKLIRLFSNDPRASFVTLTMSGSVTPIVHLLPNRLLFQDVAITDLAKTRREFSVRINQSVTAERVSARSLTPAVSVAILPSTDTEAQFVASLSPDLPVGEMREKILVEITQPGRASLRRVLPVYLSVVYPYSFEKGRLKFNEQSLSKRLVVRANSRNPLPIAAAVPSSPLVSVELVTLAEGRDYAVDVAVDVSKVEDSLRAVVSLEDEAGKAVAAPLVVSVTKAPQFNN